MIALPFWFWFLTTTVALGAIAISAFVVMNLKLGELDALFRRVEPSVTSSLDPKEQS